MSQAGQNTANSSRLFRMTEAVRTITLAIAFAVGAGGAAAAQTEAPDLPLINTGSERNIVYATGETANGPIDLTLDIYAPERARRLCAIRKMPFVLLIHGGGFKGGSKEVFKESAEQLRAAGLAAIAINYRLVKDDPIVGTRFEALWEDFQALGNGISANAEEFAQLNAAAASMEDTVAALEWLDDNAINRCLDMGRFAILGRSAGAVITLHVTYGLDEYGIEVPKPRVAVDLWGRLLLEDGERVIDGEDAPLMIIHGTEDKTVDYAFARQLQMDAAYVGLPHTFYTMKNGRHGISVLDPENYLINGRDPKYVILRFIKDHLYGRDPLYEVKTVWPRDAMQK